MESPINGEKQLNRLATILEKKGVTSRLLGLCLNIHKGTLTNWTNNITQPSLTDIENIADFLEVDNFTLSHNTHRHDTGLVKALSEEYKRLTIQENMPLYSETIAKNGKTKKIYNPELQSKLQQFIIKYKNVNNTKENKTIFINKLFKDITEKELDEVEIFICKSEQSQNEQSFNFLVVNLTTVENKFVASFNNIDDAERFLAIAYS